MNTSAFLSLAEFFGISELQEQKVNEIFKKVFEDIKNGFPNLQTIVTSYITEFTEAKYGCEHYTMTASKEMACNLKALRSQLLTLKSFQDLKKVTGVSHFMPTSYSYPI